MCLAALATPIMIRLAAKATKRSPIQKANNEELLVLSDVLHKPDNITIYVELEPEDFLNKKVQKIWKILRDSADISLGGDRPKSPKDLPKLLAKLNIQDVLDAISSLDQDLLEFAEQVKEKYPKKDYVIQERLKIASTIVSAKLDRDTSRPSSLQYIETEDTSDVVRIEPKFSVVRKLTTAVFNMLGSFVAVYTFQHPIADKLQVALTQVKTGSYAVKIHSIAATNLPISGKILIAASVVILTLVSEVLFIVDLEAMNLDFKYLAIGYLGEAITLVPGMLILNATKQLLWFAAPVIIVFLMWVVSLIISRGFYALGFGDVLALPLLLGVPWAITGSLMLGLYSFMLGLIFALLLIIFGPKLIKDVAPSRHFPLLPPIAWGYMITWVGFALVHINTKP